MASTQDKVSSRETRKQRAFFAKTRRAEGAYATNLRKVAKAVEDIVKMFDPTDAHQVNELEQTLRRYSDLLRPWARVTAQRMLNDVSRRDEKVWGEYTRYLGLELKREIYAAPTGEAMFDLMQEQVHLITSLPLEAANRVHELVTGALYEGARAKEIGDEIYRTGEVTRARANLIARTEVGRAATSLTQARAEYVGSPGYIWRSSHDWDVRPAIGTKNFAKLNTLEMGSHRKLDGTFHRWDSPPIAATNGVRAHAGSIFNCRCYAEPVLPGESASDQGNWYEMSAGGVA